MIRRFISTLLAVAVATGVYMPYSHEEAAPAMSGAVAHEACAGHDAGS